VIDPKPLWDFDDPAGSEARFRDAAEAAASPAERAAWLTQVARALGLQERFAEGHNVLDELDVDDDEAGVRSALERGRLLRSSGDSAAARPRFEAAAARAGRAGLEELQVDALHMVAIVAPPEDQLRLNEAALAMARSAAAPAARNWDASLLNNIGMVHADAGDFTTALERFQEALDARERIGDIDRTRVAKWMVAWSLRELGRADEALAMQRALKAELEADGKSDEYVDQELDILEGRTTPQATPQA
jgi:tetratricopeptide (TPR) repeat protein